MIPLDRVRAMIDEWDAAVAGDDHSYCGACDACMRWCRAHAALRDAAPDLARDVLSLADALATAERERDEARQQRDEAESDVIDRCVPLQEEVVDLRRALTTAREATTLATEREATAVAERDTARSALDGLVAAVRAEREARAAYSAADADRRNGVRTHDEYCAAWEAYDAARTRLDALLSAAPARCV